MHETWDTERDGQSVGEGEVTAVQCEQLDLFAIAERNEKETQLSAQQSTSDTLRLGDILHVKWSNGVEWEGVYTGLSGFWDGRPEFQDERWIYATKVSRGGTMEFTATYKQFDPVGDEWYKIGRDESFQLPSKEEIEPQLTAILSGVPLKNRIDAFHHFESQLPTLSFDYHEWVSNAWDTAILKVTTLDEFLAEEKGWSCKAELPESAVRYIKTTVFETEPSKRLEVIKRMRWVKSEESGRYYMGMPAQQEVTYYGSLYARFIEEARTPSELVSIVRMRGDDSRYVKEKCPAKFWVEEEMACTL